MQQITLSAAVKRVSWLGMSLYRILDAEDLPQRHRKKQRKVTPGTTMRLRDAAPHLRKDHQTITTFSVRFRTWLIWYWQLMVAREGKMAVFSRDRPPDRLSLRQWMALRAYGQQLVDSMGSKWVHEVGRSTSVMEEYMEMDLTKICYILKQ